MNILIVDDQPLNLKLLRAMLEAEGHTVAKAADGVEALEALESHGADAIISDILMPRMDGYRLCSEVRKRKPFQNLPFIHYTATYTSPGDEKLSSDFGADVFLRKPAPAAEIIGALNRVTCKGHKVRATSIVPESDVMKEYSGQLVAKLEEKNQQLHATHTELHHLLGHSPAVIYRLKIDGQTITPVVVSDNIERLLGVSVAESTRYDWWLESLHPEDRERVLGTLARSLTTDGYSMEYRIKHKDGNYHWVEDNNRMLHDASGQATEAVGVWTDITERKRAEERLREQADIINHARDAIIILNFADQRVTFWNTGAERLYGWTAEEAIGRPLVQLIATDQQDALAKTIGATGGFPGETKHRTKAGKEIIVEGRATLIGHPDGTPGSVLLINTDITEQKKLETQLLRAQRLETIGTLASGVAHDLNNILTPILMGSELLRGMVGEESESLVSLMEKSARRGVNIVKQVLTFARGVEGERVIIDPKHLIQEMCDIACQTFPKSIEVKNHYPEDLWSIRGDPTQLHQVLLNLSVNARDAMGNTGLMTIAAENFNVDEHYASMMPGAHAGSHVMLRVSDTGPGISRAVIDKIFDPFFTTKEVGEGTGLGLSTVLGIVKSHDGFISVCSEIGNGTTFDVFLPAVINEENSRTSEISPKMFRGNGELILVIDDEPGILRVTRIILEEHNYRVLEANDALEALALFAPQLNLVDAVLTDLMMPYMDGVMLIRAIRQIKPTMKFIASTGQGEETRASELAALQVTNVLTKPYDTERLLKTLRKTLSSELSDEEN